MGAFVCGVTEVHVCVHRSWDVCVEEDISVSGQRIGCKYRWREEALCV